MKRLREGKYSFFVFFRKAERKRSEMNAPMTNPIKSDSGRPVTSILDDNFDEQCSQREVDDFVRFIR